VSTAAAGPPSTSFLARNEFLIRRLHSLSGLIPVGAYMVVHLLTNASVLESPATFQRNVYTIHSLPLLPDRRRRLAGLAAADEAGRTGHRRRSDEPDAGQALAQRLRPGGHQQRQRPDAAAGRQRVEALRRHGLRRRLPAASAAGQGDGLLGAEDHRPDGPPGRPFNRTPEGFLDRRRFGGTLYKRTAFAGATTGQQLLYALDEQVRRWESPKGKVTKYEFWDFLGPILDDNGVCRGCVAQDLCLDGDPRLSGRRGDRRHRRLRADLRPLDDVDGLHRQRRQPLLSRPAPSTATASSSRSIRRRFPAPTSCG
jgi:hypothetical protein